MKIVGVIPARWGSTRFPGKILLPLCGRPMIEWVLRAVSRSAALESVLVATDDRRIADVVSASGGRAVMTSPDHPSGTDRIAEALRSVEADAVINIQGDEPLVDPALIDALAAEMAAGAGVWDMATAASPFQPGEDVRNPAAVKVVWDAGGRAMYFSRHAIPFVRDAGAPAGLLYWRHIGIYAYRRAFLDRLVREPPCMLEQAEKLEQLRALYIGGRIKVVQWKAVPPGVDTPDDVAAVERGLRARWPSLV